MANLPLPPLVDPATLPALPAAAVLAAGEAIRAHCRWHLAPSIVQELTLDGTGGSAILLPSLFVTDITSLTIDGAPVDVSSLEWSTSGVVRVVTPDKLRAVRVTIVHGYPELPADVRSALVSLASSGELGRPSQVMVGRVMATYAKEERAGASTVPTALHAGLDRFRRPVLA